MQSGVGWICRPISLIPPFLIFPAESWTRKPRIFVMTWQLSLHAVDQIHFRICVCVWTTLMQNTTCRCSSAYIRSSLRTEHRLYRLRKPKWCSNRLFRMWQPIDIWWPIWIFTDVHKRRIFLFHIAFSIFNYFHSAPYFRRWK